MKTFYVYQLKTSNGEVIYIGKGSGNRMYHHIRIANSKSKNRLRNPKLYNKISSEIRNGGYILSQILFESENEVDCLNKEIETIAAIGKEYLCNLTDGGEGTAGHKMSEETKKKISAARTGIPRIFTDEHKRHISMALKGKVGTWKGKKLSEATKRKMSESGKGKNAGPISEKRRQAIIEGIRRKNLGM